MEISIFCAAVVKFIGLEVVSSFVFSVDKVLVGSVLGFSLDVVTAGIFGHFVLSRVTNVVLTVELLIVGLLVETLGFVVVDELVLSVESTENVVTNISSADNVVGSTFTMKSVGVGFGRGAFVVSTYEIVVKIAGVVEVYGIGFLVVLVTFLREEIVVLRFTVTLVDATGFLVVFITVDVSIFDGFTVVDGLLDGFNELELSEDETDVRLNNCEETGVLVVGFVAGFFVLFAVLDDGCLVPDFVGVVRAGEGAAVGAVVCLES